MTTMRDEGPFVVEWVAHHLVLGFDRILVATNDCTDGTDRLLAALAARGFVSHLDHHVSPGASPQDEAFGKLRAAFAVDAADWLMVMDVDEFLNVHTGDHSLAALLAQAPDDVDVITLNAATFGANGQDRWRPRPVTAQFAWRHPTRDLRSAPVKSLTRKPAHFKAIHSHCMLRYVGPKSSIRCMRADGSVFGLDMDVPFWRQIRNFRAADCRHDLAQYNHYAVKTWDTFLARRDRGRSAVPMDRPNDRHSADYYDARAVGTVEDRTILRYAAPLRRKMAEMLADPDIARCHDICIRVYRRRMRGYWAAFGDDDDQGATPD
jgi:Glycosyl transferase family 2